jgi:hypothetical protein
LTTIKLHRRGSLERIQVQIRDEKMVTADKAANPSKTTLIKQLVHERQEEREAGITVNPLDESESFQQL